jgi:flagellar biosynthesis chaperone FliJ
MSKSKIEKVINKLVKDAMIKNNQDDYAELTFHLVDALGNLMSLTEGSNRQNFIEQLNSQLLETAEHWDKVYEEFENNQPATLEA